MPGVGPAAEPLLFRQKWPKPLTPRLASLRAEGRQSLGRRTNSPGSNKARQRIRASLRWASRQASGQGRWMLTEIRTYGKQSSIFATHSGVISELSTWLISAIHQESLLIILVRLMGFKKIKKDWIDKIVKSNDWRVEKKWISELVKNSRGEEEVTGLWSRARKN